MALPVPPEPLADVRGVLGTDVLMRQVWAGEASTVFQVLRDGAVAAYLKVGRGLADERDRLEWLDGRLPVARVLSFGRSETTDWLLLTPLSGMELANLKHTESPARIVGLLADALHIIHAMPADGCPFGEPAPDAVMTHGDACLPNFMFAGDRMTGVLDVGEFGLGDPARDFALAVWSIGFNLGPGHARTFLDAYDPGLLSGEFELLTDAEGNESLQRRSPT